MVVSKIRSSLYEARDRNVRELCLRYPRNYIGKLNDKYNDLINQSNLKSEVYDQFEAINITLHFFIDTESK